MRSEDNSGWEGPQGGLYSTSPHSRQGQTRVLSRVLLVSKNADCTAIEPFFFQYISFVCHLPAIHLWRESWLWLLDNCFVDIERLLLGDEIEQWGI